MNIIRQVVVFDAVDLAEESHFWAAVLDGQVVADDEDGWHSVIDGAGRFVIGVQLAPDHIPPVWPDGDPKQQVHLDFHVEDPSEAHDRVIEYGASLLQDGDFSAAHGHQVYADPAGHPFCLGWGHPSDEALRVFLEKRTP